MTLSKWSEYFWNGTFWKKCIRFCFSEIPFACRLNKNWYFKILSDVSCGNIFVGSFRPTYIATRSAAECSLMFHLVSLQHFQWIIGELLVTWNFFAFSIILDLGLAFYIELFMTSAHLNCLQPHLLRMNHQTVNLQLMMFYPCLYLHLYRCWRPIGIANDSFWIFMIHTHLKIWKICLQLKHNVKIFFIHWPLKKCIPIPI